MRVADMLRAKANGTAVMTVRPEETIRTLAQRLQDEGIGAMIVSDDGSSLDGIISERDVTYGLAVHGERLHALTVSALMTKVVITCSPKDSIAQVAQVMTQRRIRHLPVKEGQRLVGVISIGDVLKHRLTEMQLEANVLRDIAIASR
ncbi:MAG: CBS domain-containing protein [Hyphomicrobium sp.]|jgi:CBS domain-containing protein